MDLAFLWGLSITILLTVGFTVASQYQETKTEVCYNDVFRARCPYTQHVLVSEARYGHIEVSKCVSDMFASFGTLGCYADVKQILSQRCTGKQRCEVAMPDPEIIATKTCPTGLPMYLEVSYVCIPETLQSINCETVRATTRVQYITSDQVQKGTCVNIEDNVSKQASFKANINMKIKFTFRIIKANSLSQNISEPYGYLVDKNKGTTAIQLTGDPTESLSQGSEVDLVLASGQGHLVIIGFQEIGCSDMTPPPYTWAKRDSDITTLGCHNNDFTWQLKCVASNWIGSTGNCTNEVVKPVTKKEHVEKEPPINREGAQAPEVISKEILFTLIIGITVFMCAVVITAGFVCLKRAKYKSQATPKDAMELNTILYDGEGTTSWSRSKAINGQAPVNNKWQQTINSQGVPGNQKYYILDREDVNTLRV